jgi:hypothetical protein
LCVRRRQERRVTAGSRGADRQWQHSRYHALGAAEDALIAADGTLFRLNIALGSA